jgi:hypothetical protein
VNLSALVMNSQLILYPVGVSSPAGEGMIFLKRARLACPLQSLFPPFRIRLLVLDSSSNAERGSGGEVEIFLNDGAIYHPT